MSFSPYQWPAQSSSPYKAYRSCTSYAGSLDEGYSDFGTSRHHFCLWHLSPFLLLTDDSGYGSNGTLTPPRLDCYEMNELSNKVGFGRPGTSSPINFVGWPNSGCKIKMSMMQDRLFRSNR